MREYSYRGYADNGGEIIADEYARAQPVIIASMLSIPDRYASKLHSARGTVVDRLCRFFTQAVKKKSSVLNRKLLFVFVCDGAVCLVKRWYENGVEVEKTRRAER